MRSILLSLVLAAACTDSTPPPAPRPAPSTVEKDPAAARKLLASGAPAIDVRTPSEFAGGHLPQAANIPVDQIGSRLAEVDALVGGDKARAIVVYCAKGGRAAHAKQVLEQAGYTNVVNGGGYADLR